jgi:pilus assembly protein Flp/PilA
MTFQIGTQVIYVPPRAQGDIHHAACERGFVVEDDGGEVLNCMFWRKGLDRLCLRSTRPEGVRRSYLVERASVPQDKVRDALTEMGQGLVEYALILVLVAIVVIVILALLGPAIGNIFSTMYQNVLRGAWLVA